MSYPVPHREEIFEPYLMGHRRPRRFLAPLRFAGIRGFQASRTPIIPHDEGGFTLENSLSTLKFLLRGFGRRGLMSLSHKHPPPSHLLPRQTLCLFTFLDKPSLQRLYRPSRRIFPNPNVRSLTRRTSIRLLHNLLFNCRPHCPFRRTHTVSTCSTMQSEPSLEAGYNELLVMRSRDRQQGPANATMSVVTPDPR